MATDTPLQVSLRDPLTEVTRKERRTLLAVSTLTLFISQAQLVPTKIEALGIELHQENQHALLIGLAFLVAYFLFAFFIYGLSDFLAWRLSYHEGAKVVYDDFFAKIHKRSSTKEKDAMPSAPDDWVPRWPKHMATPVSYLRALFDFLFPILLGSYAIYCLFPVSAGT